MNHLLVGAAAPYLIGLLLYALLPAKRRFALLCWVPLVMTLCAIWAVVPDLPRALGMYELYMEMAESPATNIFFFHHAIDAREAESPLHLVLFLGMAGSLMAAAWYELFSRERTQQA